MPTYDYVCSNCGKTTEIVHSISGSGPSACPACGVVGTLTKAFNPPTIHFKGSGWAKKDRSGGRPKPAKAPDSSESSAAGSAAKSPADSGDGGSSGESGDGGDSPAGKPRTGSSSSEPKPAAPAAAAPSAD
jgi:putative FmdB family regulatory protein